MADWKKGTKKAGLAWATGGGSLAYDAAKRRRMAKAAGAEEADAEEPNSPEGEPVVPTSHQTGPDTGPPDALDSDRNEPSAGEQEAPAFDVVLQSDGGKTIKAIKAVRSATGIPLKEAKNLVENLPQVIRGLRQEDAVALQRELSSVGAVAEIQAAGAGAPALIEDDGSTAASEGFNFSTDDPRVAAEVAQLKKRVKTSLAENILPMRRFASSYEGRAGRQSLAPTLELSC